MSIAPDCAFEGENSFKVKGRGRFDVRVEASQNICAVNSAVTLVSSFAGWDLVEEVQHWNKPPTPVKSRGLRLWICRTNEITPLVHVRLLAHHHPRPDQHLQLGKRC